MSSADLAMLPANFVYKSLLISLNSGSRVPGVVPLPYCEFIQEENVSRVLPHAAG